MKVTKLEESGFDSALYGFSLSYRKPGTTSDDWWTEEKTKRAYKAALANANRDKGHNKFLEHMQVWFSIEATLEWWKQFDTYRVGLSKQSTSTMHTLDSGEIKPDHFDIHADEFNSPTAYQIYLTYLRMISDQESRLKSKTLPQGYLQEREVNLNYKVIRHIAMQRFTHRIKDWQTLLSEMIKQIDHPEFIQLAEEAKDV